MSRELRTGQKDAFVHWYSLWEKRHNSDAGTETETEIFIYTRGPGAY